MPSQTIGEALAPFHDRLPKLVRTQEILRVAADVLPHNGDQVLEAVRKEVLAWAKKRCGGELPRDAWDGLSFEYFAGGRTTLGARIVIDEGDIWAISADDPDKNVAGRVWTTEVTAGKKGDETPRLGVRLLVSTPEQSIVVEPAVPGFVLQIANRMRLKVGGIDIASSAEVIDSTSDVERLISLLRHPDRKLPVIVAAGDERSLDPSAPNIDAASLSKALVALAHVVVVPAAFTYSLSDAFGKMRSVYHGAVRVYLAGFDSDADPYDHKLFLGEAVKASPDTYARILRQVAATESIRRNRINHDVLPFMAVRSAAAQLEQEDKVRQGAAVADQLKSANKRIEALEAQVNSLKTQQDDSLEIATQEEDRARTAESQLFGARQRIRLLESRLESGGAVTLPENEMPTEWKAFADWCDHTFAGRLVLAPNARSGTKKADFLDIGLAARCLTWLAETCREARLGGGMPLANIQVESGVQNAPCGADAFHFMFRGRSLVADWHIKNGGNTRDRTRCLRIYYTWLEETQEIVVAEMPAHRRTGAS